MSAFLLPTLSSSLAHSPATHEAILVTFFLVLGFMDVRRVVIFVAALPFLRCWRLTVIAAAFASLPQIVHIGVTLLYVPERVMWSVSKWTTLLAGNVFITAVLFLVRCGVISPLACCGIRPLDAEILDLGPGRLSWIAGIGRPTYAISESLKRDQAGGPALVKQRQEFERKMRSD